MWDKIKNISSLLRNLLIWLVPFFISLFILAIPFYFFKRDFNKYIELIKILVWPITLLVALFFFRKVVTYLFFSMNEFNFFGAKGELKDVQKIIDEKVQIRLSEQNDTKIREEEIAKINKDLDSAKESKETLQQKADKNLELARKIFRLYKTLSNKHEETTQELNILRQKQKERDDRMAIIEELRRRRNEQVHQSRYSTVEETPDQDKHECK